MPRNQDVELPKLKRTRAGHVVYGKDENSICPRHQFCAYTGDEPDRCKVCHSNTHLEAEHGDLPPDRKAPCLCHRCGELFTAWSSFDLHRSAGKCRNPEKRGLILIDQNGWLLWGKPGSRPDDI